MVSIFPARDPPLACCGSRIDYKNATVPTGPFLRIATGASFYVARGFSFTEDTAPPSRILDLRLVHTEKDSLMVGLEWTAPGGDYDFGKGETARPLPAATTCFTL